MDTIRPFLDFLADHTYAVVFVVTLIDSLGLPFPGRLLLVVAGAFTVGGADTAGLILVAASGAVLGDHIVYLGGRVAGARILGFFCRVTLNSERCLERTQLYFSRFGPPMFIIGRFVAGIRVVAITLAGTGLVRYRTFLLYDVLGALSWAATFVLIGYAVRDHWSGFVEDYGRVPALFGLLVVGILTVVGWRLLRRTGAHRRVSRGSVFIPEPGQCDVDGPVLVVRGDRERAGRR